MSEDKDKMSKGSAIEDLERWAQLAGNELLSMPVSVYTSAELLEQEVEKLFYKQWVCVGHVSELQNPGDYLTFDIVDKPVLIVRGETGKIRAYSNVCRHRGTVIASGNGSCKLFSCPYHAWSYDLNGRLRAAPFMDEDIETTELVQQGLSAGVDTAGIHHPDERAIWEFGHYLAKQLTGAPTIDVTAINFS